MTAPVDVAAVVVTVTAAAAAAAAAAADADDVIVDEIGIDVVLAEIRLILKLVPVVPMIVPLLMANSIRDRNEPVM